MVGMFGEQIVDPMIHIERFTQSHFNRPWEQGIRWHLPALPTTLGRSGKSLGEGMLLHFPQSHQA